MWQFFQWAWNLSWGDGIALMICLFAFWYGKKWIDQKFGTDSFSKRQKRELKQIVKEAIEEGRQVFLVGATGSTEKRLQKLKLLDRVPQSHINGDRLDALRLAVNGLLLND